MTDVTQMSDADLMAALGGSAPQQPAPDVGSMVQAEAQRQGVDPALALAVAHRESGLDQSRVSPAGAIGVMQLMPGTAGDLGVDPHDVAQNIQGGVSYLKQQLDRFGDPRLALAAYNAGPGAVQKAGGVPNFPETKAYVNSILPEASVSNLSDADLMKALGMQPAAAQQSPAPEAQATPAPAQASAIPDSVPYVLNQATGKRYNDAQEATLRRMLMNGESIDGLYGETAGSQPRPGDRYVALDGTIKQAAPLTLGQQASDIVKSAASGAARAGAGIEDSILAATPLGFAAQGLRTAAALAGGGAPSSAPFGEVTAALDPHLHTPQTMFGSYARSIGEMLPNAVAPGGVAQRIMSVVAPAVGSQAAGDLAAKLGASEPVQAVARFLGATGGGLASSLRLTPGEAPPEPMSLEDLKAAKTAAYKAAEGSGATIPQQAAQQMVGNISQLVQDKGGAALYPTAAKMVSRLQTLVKNGITPTQLDDFRGQIYEQLMSDGGKEANVGRQMREQIDGLLNSDIGDPNWAAARDLNSRYMKARTVSDRLDSAGLRASSTYSGGNYANAVRQQMRTLVDPTSGALIRNLTPDEEAAIRRVVNGTAAQNALRGASKIANNKFVQTGLMLMTPHGVGYPVAEATGGALRRLSDAQTERGVQGLIDLMSTGGNATPRAGLTFQPGMLDPFNVGTVLATSRPPPPQTSPRSRPGMFGAAYH